MLPPRPVLPGDTGWDERIRHVAEPRRGLANLRSTLEIHCDAVLLASQLNMTVEIEIYLCNIGNTSAIGGFSVDFPLYILVYWRVNSVRFSRCFVLSPCHIFGTS